LRGSSAPRLLLARCEANLNAKVDGQIPGAVELREDILGEFGELFAIDATPDGCHELDFFEVRFNRAFFTFRATRVRSGLDHLNSQTRLPEPSNEIELIEQELDDEVLARISDLQGVGANPEDRLFRKQVFDAIKALPADQRKAVALVYLLGFQQGSEDPSETTAATLCGVDARTIHNRLKRAFATLSKLQEVA
jgi:DNA-directed RNA polymerase specialized sigma24 family protein